MSNLGLYQTMTATAKKVGGPIGFVVLNAVGGYIVISCVKAGVKKIVGSIRKYNEEKNSKSFEVIIVNEAGTSNDGLVFKIGDKYRIIEKDGEAVLIEKIGDANNPYFVSVDLLQSISNFNLNMESEI